MISDVKIWEYIHSDLPLNDLTTSLCKGKERPAKLEIFTRERIVLSNAATAIRIAEFLECKDVNTGKDGEIYKAKEQIFNASGSFENLHKAWKLIQILFEYSCKISTHTADMVALCKDASPYCQVQTTRKNFPFAKEFCLNAVISGGGRIHRANLSDSVLFFANHIKAYKSFENFCEHIADFKTNLPEKKIMIECENLSEFQTLLHYKPDVIQCDKFSPSQLSKAIELKNKTNSSIIVTAAGGINLKNCKEFAKTGINAVITSAPYTQGTADLTGKISFI
ncbi:ModD protein [Campylobacter sp. 7477a]|uniref:ModD protein n=1 Tax=Campylobacter sp. 7477a TaxID=2735741 RepID=UPI00301488AE|nr:ModD protein [Campylobacter sp. 7477a]